MTIHLTFGFKELKRGDPTVLYCGTDADRALAALEAPPPRGIIRTEYHRTIAPFKRHKFVDNGTSPPPSTGRRREISPSPAPVD